MSSLAALRVLDLSEGVAGPYCAKLLADYGAEVIKIERPGGGDQPHPERGALFLYLNTSKKGITLDISQSTGARLLRRLVTVSEVMVESYPPGYLAGLGLGYAALSALKPRLVVTSITPFGQTGPYSSYKATNLTAFAAGGQMSLTGEPNREPLKNGGYQAEYQAGLHAFAATAVAALSADATEVGQHVDISAMECQASALELYLSFYAYLKRDLSQRRGNVPSAFVHTLQDLLTYPGPPFRMSGLPLRQAQGRLWQAGRAPMLGEHNVDIYCGELGLSREELSILRASGVI